MHHAADRTMPPTWLKIVGWGSLGLGFLSVVAILLDIVAAGRRQAMRVMEDGSTGRGGACPLREDLKRR